MKHDVNYSVETFQTIDQLNQKVDDLRLEAMAALEELDQTLTKNRKLAESDLWKVDALQSHLETAVTILRKNI